MSTPSPVTGFVLAGGRSRRMGRDKSLLDWHGTTLLDHMTRILATVCDPVRVVGRDELPDRLPSPGPIGGIATALDVSRTENNLIIAVDLPLLTSDFLKYFKERCRQSNRLLTVCNIESAFPLCLGIRLGLKNILDEYIASGKRSLHGLIQTTVCEIVTADEVADAGFSEKLFLNINSEADYRKARPGW